MEIKVGDYVRIKWGNGLQTISQCKNIVDMGDTQYAKDDFYIHTDKSGEVIYKTMIVKSSPNIIDLIEVGDYVNGGMVDLINDKYIGIENQEGYIIKKGFKIERIVTKELFESMEYKVC